jgi:hypothetical protein
LKNGGVPIIVAEGRNVASEPLSLNPCVPAAAFGPRAREFTAGHHKAVSPYIGSPYDLAASAGGYVLLLGVDQDRNTTLHCAEAAAQAPYLGETDGSRQWSEHPIDPFNSQYHDLHWVDIDGDGKPELVTGKRYRAHNDNDPGSFDDYGIYYFKWNGESFTKNPIIFGKIRETKGLGIFSEVVDLNGDGRLDILAPGKDGLAILWNVTEIDRTPAAK